MPGNNASAYHALAVEDALAALGTRAEGLSDEEAAARLEAVGPNELPRDKEPSRVLLFFKQFKSALIYILLAAGAVSLASGHAFDAAAIGIIVAVNASIGFMQERKAERALARLRDMIVPTVGVRRGDHVVRIGVSQLVPGDVVLVAQGDRVPADLRLLSVRDLRADESALTGESVPTAKRLEPVAAEAAVGDRACMLFMGTLVTSGEGIGVAAATGQSTVFGAIAKSLAAIKRERTPLERRMDQLGRTLAVAAIFFAGAIFFIGLWRGLSIYEMFFVAVAMAVSSIPEGLPAVLAVVLAIGVQRMARRSAITRRLPAVETLGVVDVICTDKTGTLTEDKMTVRKIATLSHEVRVTGEGWEPKGEFRIEDDRVQPAEHPSLQHLLHVAALCNRASVERQDGRWIAVGDPTEAALVSMSGKAGYEKSDLLRSGRTIDEIPFSSERKYRAILHDYVGPDERSRREIMVVGAFEVLLAASSKVAEFGGVNLLTPEAAGRLEDANERMAAEAMRIVAVGYRETDAARGELRQEDIRDLTMLGLVGMIDPPRKGVAEAIGSCRRAGIRVIMNTGDHKLTAVAIAREVGILGREESADGKVFTDAEVAAMPDVGLRERLKEAAVFARVSPQTKLRIVTQLQTLGHTVAMTGDGINDAPSLKRADIGVAMGITGTDVTREVADMVLSDDNFVSIVNAVEEGRIIFRNVKQTTAYLVMTNVGEVVTIVTALLLGLPLPLLPAQILWLNLVTDGFNDIALATERRHGDELARPPRRKTERILSRNLLLLTLIASSLMAAGTMILFVWASGRNGLNYARTTAFLSMALFQLWNVSSMRSLTDSVFALGWRTNPWVLRSIALSLGLIAMIMYVPALQAIFGFAPVGWREWALAAAVSSSVLLAVEGYKMLVRRKIIPEAWV